MLRRTFSIEQNIKSHMGDAEPHETIAAVRRGFEIITEVCNAQLTEIQLPARAQIRVSFSSSIASLGLAHRSGWMLLNSARPVRKIIERHIIEGLVVHEIIAHNLGFGHSEDRTSILHGDLPVYHLSPADVLLLQRRYGEPKQKFHPSERVHKGLEYNRAVQEYDEANTAWKLARNLRDYHSGNRDWKKMAIQNKVVKTALADRDKIGRKVARLYREWWEINKKWNTSGVPGVIRI